MDLIITILPVVTKDLPISPRFTPYDFFYRDASSALLQLVNQWLNFTYIILYNTTAAASAECVCVCFLRTIYIRVCKESKGRAPLTLQMRYWTIGRLWTETFTVHALCCEVPGSPWIGIKSHNCLSRSMLTPSWRGKKS